MKKVLLLILFSSIVIFSQSKKTTVITMEDALTLALEKNAELKIGSLEINKSEEKLKEARSGLFPQLNASGQYQRYIELPVIFLPPGSPFGSTLKIGADNSIVGAVSLSVPLFSWQLYKGIGIASDLLSVSQENFRSIKNKVIGDVKKSFLTVLLARETKEVMIQSLKNAENNYENIKRLNSAGQLSDYDVLRAEVQVENLKPIVLQMENNYKLTIEALKIAIGLPAEEDIDIVGNMDFAEQYQVPSEQNLLDELLQNNPQLSLLDKQVLLNDENISIEKGAYLPTLAGFGNYQYQAQSNHLKFSDYNWVKTFVLGLQLQIPIFNGFKTAARINQAEISLDQAKEQKRNYTEAIKTQALSILYRIEQAYKRIQGQNKTVKTAQEGYEISKRRLQNSLATQLEVNDAELALRQAKLNRLQAVYDLKIAEAELDNVLGRVK